MFGVKHNECVGFESRWRVKKVYSVESVQTSEFSQKEMSTSTAEKKDMEIQTESPELPTTCEVDEEKLAAWLKRIYPSVKRELDDSANSKAFRGYKLLNDSTDANCKLVQSVSMSAHVKDAAIGSYVSAISWNCSNTMLAVSCTYKHNSWCYHEGTVLFYALDKDDNLTESPKLKLSTESCVTDLEFHSSYPAIVAAGLYSGAIIIWDVQKEEQTLTKVDGHGDRITQLSWIIDINCPKTLNLASASLDGLLSLWDFNSPSLVLKERHQIRPPRFPKSSDPNDGTVRNVTRGVTCFNFSKHSPELFIVGAEGGLVVQCSLLGTNKIKAKSGDAPLLDSAIVYYHPHQGEVNSVSFSPNRKDMFMTSGSDLEIRIYMINQEEPAQIIFLKQPLNCVIWVPYEDRLVCGCGKSGIIEIFQLIEGKRIEKTSKDKVKVENLTEIQINQAKSNIVVVGTESGNIQMWRVPWALFGNMSR